MRRRLRVAAALVAVVGAAVVLATAPARAATPVLDATLDNGLRVLLLEDRRNPIVSVQLWYRVGSRDERKGRVNSSPALRAMAVMSLPWTLSSSST